MNPEAINHQLADINTVCTCDARSTAVLCYDGVEWTVQGHIYTSTASRIAGSGRFYAALSEN